MAHVGSSFCAKVGRILSSPGLLQMSNWLGSCGLHCRQVFIYFTLLSRKGIFPSFCFLNSGKTLIQNKISGKHIFFSQNEKSDWWKAVVGVCFLTQRINVLPSLTRMRLPFRDGSQQGGNQMPFVLTPGNPPWPQSGCLAHCWQAEPGPADL